VGKESPEEEGSTWKTRAVVTTVTLVSAYYASSVPNADTYVNVLRALF
jgi:hypothetical protein